jgi:predicted alpha/beta hydrolase family esterase
MAFGAAADWARAWGSQLVDIGDAGHINVDSGHGRWPLGRLLVERQIQRLERQHRSARAHPMEFGFAI